MRGQDTRLWRVGQLAATGGACVAGLALAGAPAGPARIPVGIALVWTVVTVLLIEAGLDKRAQRAGSVPLADLEESGLLVDGRRA